jgi:hypothetical protein
MIIKSTEFGNLISKLSAIKVLLGDAHNLFILCARTKNMVGANETLDTLVNALVAKNDNDINIASATGTTTFTIEYGNFTATTGSVRFTLVVPTVDTNNILPAIESLTGCVAKVAANKFNLVNLF